MKWFMKILLAAFIMLVTSTAPVYADDDEGDEGANGSEADSGESGDDEKESAPGFEFAFAVAGALAAARLLKARVL